MTTVRDAMILGLQRFAKTVSVIATEHAGQRIAMTATAVCEVSLDPPTLLVCINSTASISRLMLEGDSFTVNILSADQQEVASACSGKLLGEERFKVGAWNRQASGHWVLEGAQAAFLCSRGQCIGAGSHHVFIGRVDAVRISDVVRPLVYLNRRYVSLEPERIAS